MLGDFYMIIGSAITDTIEHLDNTTATTLMSSDANLGDALASGSSENRLIYHLHLEMKKYHTQVNTIMAGHPDWQQGVNVDYW